MIKFFLLTALIFQSGSILAESCKAHMRDSQDTIIDTFSVWTPHYNRSCQLALENCNQIMDSRIRNGETNLNLGQCTAEWRNSLPSRPTQRMAKNYCNVELKNIHTNQIVKTYTDVYRGSNGFLSWMTACNKAMTTCMLNRPILNKDIDCVREEYKKIK